MRLSLAVCILLFSSAAFAQNLVPNPGFEDYYACPDGIKQLEKAKYWQSANAGSPEFYHGCGYTAEIDPYKGKGMGGAIFLDALRSGVEYLQTELLDTLQKGKNYCFSMQLLASAKNAKLIDRVGANFTKVPLRTPNWEPFILHPKVFSEKVVGQTNEWEELTAEFIAKGGERYLTIGNFFESWYLNEERNPEGTSKYCYYFVDEVKVWPKVGSCETEIDFAQREAPPEKMGPTNHVVYFEKDKSILSLDEQYRLLRFLKGIAVFNPKQLRVQGHTDADASIEYNVELSKRRAETVNQFIKKHSELSTYVLWEGESKPLNANLNKAEKAKNRRVEIKVNLP
ncbi:MAG: OmpA family protein [Vicingaceae bacterium]